jgi:predicted N-formylglutamate amidohydrolase
MSGTSGDETGRIIECGNTPVLIVSDHASNHVPADIDLCIDAALLNDHIAIDIGVAEVTKLIAQGLGCTAILGGVSRLVIDLNREEDAPGLIPESSDGQAIPGNVGADKAARLDRFHRPYHRAITERLARIERPFMLSIHSFTSTLASDPAQVRPWEIGVLYNEDDRAPRIAIPLLEAAGLIVGDQLPYSGRLLNATMNRHAEANGIPYLGLELRQDIAGTPTGQRRYADILLPIVERCRAALA